MKQFGTAFLGTLAGLASLAGIHIPVLSWIQIPAVHANDTALFIIALFKASATAAVSWLTVTGCQHARRKIVKKWKSFRNK